MAPLDREYDEDIGDDFDEADAAEDALDDVEHALSEVLTAIPKVSELLVDIQCISNENQSALKHHQGCLEESTASSSLARGGEHIFEERGCSIGCCFTADGPDAEP